MSQAPSISRRVLRVVLVVFVIAVAVLVAGGAWLAITLSRGPVSLAFAKPAIAGLVNRVAAPVEVSFADVSLSLAPDSWQPSLLIQNLRAREPGGGSSVGMPAASITLDPGALLWHQAFAPESITVIQPDLRLVREADGRIDLGFATESADAGENDQSIWRNLVDTLLAPASTPTKGALQRVEISNGKLSVTDRATGKTLKADTVGVTFQRTDEGLSARASMQLAQATQLPNAGAPATLTLGGVYDNAQATTELKASFANLLPGTLASLAPSLPLAGVDAAIGGDMAVSIGADDLPGPVTYALTLGAGTLRWPDLTVGEVKVDRAAIAGTYDDAAKRLVVSSMTAAAYGAAIEGAGEALLREDSPSLKATLKATTVDLAAVAALWPDFASEPPGGNDLARAWVLENVTAGSVPAAEATLDFTPADIKGPIRAEAITGTFTIAGATVRYLPSMAPVTDITGSASFTADAITLLPSAGLVAGLRIGPSTVKISDISDPATPTRLATDLAIEGSLADMIGLLSAPPVDIVRLTNVTRDRVGGNGSVKLRLDLPLLDDVRPEDIGIGVDGDLGDAALTALAPGYDLTAGKLSLAISDGKMRLTGNAKVNGVPVSLDARSPVATKGALPSVDVRASLDPADFRALHLGELARFDEGRIATTLGVSRPDEGATELAITADIKDAAFALPQFGWTKPRGTDGKLEARLSLRGADRIEVAALTAEAPDLAIDLNGVLEGAPLRPTRIDAPVLRIGATDASLKLATVADGALDIGIDAKRLDLRPLLAWSPETPAADELVTQPATMRLNAGEIVVEDKPLRDVQATLDWDGRAPKRATLAALLDGGGSVNLALEPAETGHRLSITSTDAGRLFDALGGGTKVRGGTLKLEARITRPMPPFVAAGRVDIGSFRIVDPGLPGGSGDGLAFHKLVLPFSLSEHVVTITDVRCIGPSLGITASGTIDLGRRKLNVAGSVTPAVGVNRVIGDIPLIGDFLRGRNGIGAFAAPYSVTGSFDDPKVSASTLAAFVPGMLRDLFSDLP